MSTPPFSLSAALALASEVTAQVVAGASLSAALARLRSDRRDAGPALRGAVLDLTYSALRDYGFIDRLIASLVDRPPKPAARALLMASLTALRAGRRSPHAIVDQSVEAAVAVGVAKGFVNAVLRRYLRERGRLEAMAEATDEGLYRHPEWWIDLVKAAYPAHWAAVLAAGNRHPPMTVRVNRRRSSPESCLARLDRAGLEPRQIGPWAIRVRPVPVDALPGFREGELSVQDAGAQHAAPLLDLGSGHRVLDACAAPGGKSAHILELADVALTAIDIDAGRVERIRENLVRLGLAATVRVGDALEPQTWWDGARFDRILLDVPCSASGVAGRHPDVKWLRRAADIGEFAKTQARLLDAMWQLLAPGGKLLYSTCSVFPAENAEQVEAFLRRRRDALRMPSGLPGGGMLLPGEEHDGFFYALIQKRP